jgi:hypothetical protein
MNGAVFYAVFAGALLAGCAVSTESEDGDEPIDASSDDEAYQGTGAPATHGAVCGERWASGSLDAPNHPDAPPFKPGALPVACRNQEDYRGDPSSQFIHGGETEDNYAQEE